MLNWIVLSIIVVFVIRGIAYYGQSYLMNYVGQRVIIDIRKAVLKAAALEHELLRQA